MNDLISRQVVLDAMSETWKHICYVARRRKPTKGEEAVYSDMVGTIKQLSSVRPQEPKIGHWIDTNSESFEFHRVYKCSECGNTEIEYPEGICRHFRYCPNCGCRMVEPQESEDKE